MPTEKPGDAEPGMTCLTRELMPDSIEQAPPEWKQVLELLAELIEEKGIANVLPLTNHGRAIYWVRLWLTYQDRPEWLTNVVTTIGKSLKMIK